MAESSEGKLVPIEAGARRSKRPAQQLPVQIIETWDSVYFVKNALSQMVNAGSFMGVADIWDAMAADDRISGCLTQRIDALFGCAMSLELPSMKEKEDQQETEIQKRLKKDWTKMFPKDQLLELLRWGIGLNAGIGQIIWETTEEAWTPTIKVWHPRHLRWDMTEEAFYIQTKEESLKIDPNNGEWLIYAPRGLRRGWIHARVRPLVIPWLLRTWGKRDWARHSEVFGIPTRVGRAPSNANKEHKDSFFRALCELSTEPVIMLEQGLDPSSSFDYEIIEAAGSSPDVFDRLIAHADVSIAITLLGQNLTTEVEGGSFAAAGVHNRIRNDILSFDACSLSEALHDQVLKRWAALNFGPDQEVPVPTWDTEPPEDVNTKATAMNTVGDAIGKLRAAGVYVDAMKLMEQLGVPMLDEAEAAKLKSEDEAKAQQELEAARAQPQQLNQAHSNNHSSKAGMLAGQLFADDVADAARDQAAKAVAPDLKALLNIVDHAKDFDEMRRMLTEAYANMDPASLAYVIEKASLLAELNGRYSVLEDL